MSALMHDGVGSTTQRETLPSPIYMAPERPSEKGAGWVLFATIAFGVAATLSVIWGIAAVSTSNFFVANASYILIQNLHTWGWIVMGLGALEFLAAASIWLAGTYGRWFGIGVAALCAIAAMMTIPAYPFWSLVLVALDVLVIYGLSANVGKPRLNR